MCLEEVQVFEWWCFESDNGGINGTIEGASQNTEDFASQTSRHESMGVHGDGLMLLHQRLDVIERRLMGFRCTVMVFITFVFFVVVSLFMSLVSK